MDDITKAMIATLDRVKHHFSKVTAPPWTWRGDEITARIYADGHSLFGEISPEHNGEANLDFVAEAPALVEILYRGIISDAKQAQELGAILGFGSTETVFEAARRVVAERDELKRRVDAAIECLYGAIAPVDVWAPANNALSILAAPMPGSKS